MPADIPVSAFDRDSVNVEAPWMTRKESGLRFSGSTSSRNRDRALTGLGVIAGLAVSNAATLRYIEGWSWVRSFYFTIITATTVGYGDISPATTAGRWVTIVFIWLSIVLISFCCGSFFAYYGDLTEQALEHAIADTVGAVDEGGGEREKTAAVRTKKTEQDSLLRSTARTLAVCFLRIGVCTATGVVVFAYSEGWSFENALYFTTYTVTTVGYGDYTTFPGYSGQGLTDATMVFCMFYAFIGVSLVGMVVAKMQDVLGDFEKRSALTAWTKLDPETVTRYDLNGNGTVDQNEFVLALLLELGHVEPELVGSYRAKFEEFADASGQLDDRAIGRMQQRGGRAGGGVRP